MNRIKSSSFTYRESCAGGQRFEADNCVAIAKMFRQLRCLCIILRSKDAKIAHSR
ncbi:hypothetical protein CEV32_2371 [Brucella rhizosphaerae]|uniref:Uncharacterized protein n=1 Tax=Brucella rhizosphaerae TaxID=571254 RepID=A0A256F520_9HYPH|nr:hypothetical protein CEV32_2371 [Brucella rhizosphaerae]